RELTETGRIKCPLYNIIAEWVKHAWYAIDIEQIKRSFKCCGILVAIDGSEDDLIFDHVCVENNEVDEYIFRNDLPYLCLNNTVPPISKTLPTTRLTTSAPSTSTRFLASTEFSTL
ncbi:3448_t:CDS:2, partial [Racocetra persica]